MQVSHSVQGPSQKPRSNVLEEVDCSSKVARCLFQHPLPGARSTASGQCMRDKKWVFAALGQI
jgi:hypothetical protein